MPRFFGLMAAVALVAAPLLLSSCTSSKPSRFYVLTPLSAPNTAAAPGPSLGVGPVAIPQYLDRPEIVTRSGDNQLQLAEFDQWGGRIGDNITRVLAENLSSVLKTDRISIYPWTDSSALSAQIAVDITQFERDQSGSVTLAAFWTIADARSGKILLNGRSNIQKPVTASATGDNYEAIAAAMSQALASLTDELAAALRRLPAS